MMNKGADSSDESSSSSDSENLEAKKRKKMDKMRGQISKREEAAHNNEESKAPPVRQMITMAQTDNRSEMTEGQKRELMQNVFDKLEKHARISRLERALKLDERHLQAWLDAWEGPQQEQNMMVNPNDMIAAMAFQPGAASSGFNL